MSYPILEHDPTREALIEPSKIIKPRDVPQHCVICFFGEVIERVVAEHNAKIVAKNKWEDGQHPVYEIMYRDRRLAFYHPGIGGPLAAGLLEAVIAVGCQNFIACGGCGVLQKDIAVGHLILVGSAVRDEGVSYHYLPPAREVAANPAAVRVLTQTMAQRGVPYLIGKTWTTDAPYRETPNKIALRRQEGCVTVEMEAAGMMAVAQFRGVTFGQVLYGGDDLSGAEWDHRSWSSRHDVRENLFWLCADACLAL
ncbi:MAG: nucleoside phosphorylase [Caldilineaceae bacterium]